MRNDRIENRRLGGKSTHKIAFFIHRSICCAANIQILNWSEKYGDSTNTRVPASAERARGRVDEDRDGEEILGQESEEDGPGPP